MGRFPDRHWYTVNEYDEYQPAPNVETVVLTVEMPDDDEDDPFPVGFHQGTRGRNTYRHPFAEYDDDRLAVGMYLWHQLGGDEAECLAVADEILAELARRQERRRNG